MSKESQPSFFPSAALDHAAAGIGAGVAAVFCMHPLDLLKTRLQTSTSPGKGNVFKHIWLSLGEIYAKDGVKGLYRGVGPNIAGNASSWGLYFLFYNMLKKRGTEGGAELTSALTLLYAAEASAATAILTNPIWVVKVRMFTTDPKDPTAYRNLRHGLSNIYQTEGLRGLYRGTLLALVGVSNGALQFMAYERIKTLAFKQKRRSFERAGKPWTTEDDKLSNITYIMASGASKIFALGISYPYQVVRARIQNNATAHLYPNIPTCITRTYSEAGIRGFYRGLGTNLVRVLPGTCVTFVVYENIAWLLRRAAARRERPDSTEND